MAVGLARVAAVIDRIAADVDELARARRARDLTTAAVLPDPRAERRRRLLTCKDADSEQALSSISARIRQSWVLRVFRQPSRPVDVGHLQDAEPVVQPRGS